MLPAQPSGNHLVDIYHENHHVDDLSPCHVDERTAVVRISLRHTCFIRSTACAIEAGLTSNNGFDEGSMARAVHESVLDRIEIVRCESKKDQFFVCVAHCLRYVQDSKAIGHLLAGTLAPGR